MGFGLGTVLEMMNRFNSNRSQLNLGRGRIAHIKEQYKNVLTRSSKLNVREIPFEELEKIKEEIRKKMKRRRQSMICLYICAFALIIGLTVYWVYSLL